MVQQTNPMGQVGPAQAVQGPQMAMITDKTMVSDCLASQKFLTHCYDHSINECAHDDLRRDFMAIYQEEQNNLKALFDTMTRHGWYNLQYASPQDIGQVQQQFRQEMTQMAQPQMPGTQFYGMAPGVTPGMPPGMQQFRPW